MLFGFASRGGIWIANMDSYLGEGSLKNLSDSALRRIRPRDRRIPVEMGYAYSELDVVGARDACDAQEVIRRDPVLLSRSFRDRDFDIADAP